MSEDLFSIVSGLDAPAFRKMLYLESVYYADSYHAKMKKSLSAVNLKATLFERYMQ
jgi:hypothetical protein